MIKKLKLKSSSSPGQPNLEFEVTPITIFVGPNNSGKSKILIEIENYCRRSHGQTSDLVLNNLEFIPYSADEMRNEIEKISVPPQPGENLSPGWIILSKINPQTNQMMRQNFSSEHLVREAQNPNQRTSYFNNFMTMYTMRLDGTNRLNLLNEQNAGDLQKNPANHLAHLFLDNSLRKNVRNIIFDAFGKYYVIDPTNIGKLRVRLSDRAPHSEREEKGWENESINFHKNALEIINASDGVKAFSGIITTILAGDPKITLIDEPEAFLHPSLSNKLGNEIGKSLKAGRKRLFVSTHSSNFLMGCIQSGSPLNIVRLTYKNNVATSRILPKEKILNLMRNPLLRSTGVLNGLFYESVIVTEADSDRAFYQEINERLLANDDQRGISNCLFINAQNKQTVWDIVHPLRELGIPAAGIVDIDVLKEGGQVFSKPLKGAFVPEPSHEALNNQRRTLKTALENSGRNMKRDGGIEILDDATKETCNNFFDQLEDYGIFVVRNGELESWLKELNVTGHGSKWLIDIFEKMGDDPDDPNYLNPKENDVWDFLQKVKSWIDNPTKKGIPK